MGEPGGRKTVRGGGRGVTKHIAGHSGSKSG